jgi:hypothetical protein
MIFRRRIAPAHHPHAAIQTSRWHRSCGPNSRAADRVPACAPALARRTPAARGGRRAMRACRRGGQSVAPALTSTSSSSQRSDVLLRLVRRLVLVHHSVCAPPRRRWSARHSLHSLNASAGTETTQDARPHGGAALPACQPPSPPVLTPSPRPAARIPNRAVPGGGGWWLPPQPESALL